jgi:hypothetical protein
LLLKTEIEVACFANFYVNQEIAAGHRQILGKKTLPLFLIYHSLLNQDIMCILNLENNLLSVTKNLKLTNLRSRIEFGPLFTFGYAPPLCCSITKIAVRYAHLLFSVVQSQL